MKDKLSKDDIAEIVKLISYIKSALPVGFKSYADRLLKIISDGK